MKFCYKCKKEKNLYEFSINKNKKDGLNSECKECQKKYFSEYYFKNKNKHIERVVKNSKKNLSFLWKIKIEKGCKNCGYNKHPAALHFHHRNKEEKLFTIGVNLHLERSIILKEIDKCDVLCSNCHNEIHCKLDISYILNLENNSINNSTKINKCKGTKNKCKCGEEKTKESKNCQKCFFADKKSNIPPKEELEKLLWEIPTTKIAEKFKVSDKAVEKWAKKYNLSKPPRGYWSRNKEKQ